MKTRADRKRSVHRRGRTPTAEQLAVLAVQRGRLAESRKGFKIVSEKGNYRRKTLVGAR